MQPERAVRLPFLKEHIYELEEEYVCDAIAHFDGFDPFLFAIFQNFPSPLA